VPVVYGALNETKCHYVEIINPLLSHQIIEVVRKLPDRLRTGKALFKRIVFAMSPPIGIATTPAVPQPFDLMKKRKIVNEIRAELNTSAARELLTTSFIDNVIENMIVLDEEIHARKTGAQSSLKRIVKALLPRSCRQWIRSRFLKPRMDWNTLAFRAFLICRMCRILSEDANILDDHPHG
jgi:hypothetical protein